MQSSDRIQNLQQEYRYIKAKKLSQKFVNSDTTKGEIASARLQKESAIYWRDLRGCERVHDRTENTSFTLHRDFFVDGSKRYSINSIYKFGSGKPFKNICKNSDAKNSGP